MAWTDSTQAGIKHLAAAIEMYRADHGSYPSSLEELLEGTTAEVRDYIDRNRILNDKWRDNYKYQPQTNGFVITVTAQTGWFLKGKRTERSYRRGEALD